MNTTIFILFAIVLVAISIVSFRKKVQKSSGKGYRGKSNGNNREATDEIDDSPNPR